MLRLAYLNGSPGPVAVLGWAGGGRGGGGCFHSLPSFHSFPSATQGYGGLTYWAGYKLVGLYIYTRKHNATTDQHIMFHNANIMFPSGHPDNTKTSRGAV